MDNSLPVRSDVDSQLILIVSFRTPVKLSALKVLGVPGEEPTVVKLWCNKKEVSFDDVDAEKPNFESEVSAAAAKGAPMALPAVKLPACTSVSLFFDAEGKDTGEGGRGGGDYGRGRAHRLLTHHSRRALAVALTRVIFFGQEAGAPPDWTKLSAG